MKGILLLNGQPYMGVIADEGATVYCCDGAYAWAKGRVRIDKTVGDFDSLPYLPDPLPEEIYPSEKNDTDGEIALKKMLKAGFTDIEIYGGDGLREDHFMGNIHLLLLGAREGARVTMVTERSLIFVAKGKVAMGQYAGKTISVLPFGGDAHIMDCEGFKYPYPPCLHYGECRGISNIVESEQAYLNAGDFVLIFINQGKV